MLFQEASQAIPYINLVPWVVLLPVIGLLLNLIFGKRLGEKGVGILASLAAGGAFVVAILLAVALSGSPEPKNVPFLEWISMGNLNANWGFRVDTLSVTMMLVVSGVGTLIHIYAIGYMHQDVRHNGDPERFRRFFVYLNLFIAAMMILVSADNYLMLFIGWEGVGLCSYLLIGFWFEKGAGGIANAQAAKKAFVVNRIGDFGLLIALFLVFWNFQTFRFDEVFAKAPQAAPGVILAITLFMLLGVTGKSAQIPLYVWLPDAMAGPTPVSALIHAATMVTAGVYLVARSNPLYAAAPTAQAWVAWIGAITALFAATIAVGQFDIKRVLAYSTISQLGFMVAAVGMGAYTAGIFHLVTHAFFKALLFLSAGSVILGMERGQEAAYGHGGHGDEHGGDSHGDFDPQDMRNMGGLRTKMPVTFWVYLIGALALAGVAPLAGFFSKDEILVAANAYNPGIFVLLILAAFLTAFYMGRQIFLVFFGPARTRAAGAASDNGPVVLVPLVILALLSTVGGALNLPGISTLGKWLEHTIGKVTEHGFVPALAATAFGIALLGLFIAWLVYGRRPATRIQNVDPVQDGLPLVFKPLNAKWWVDEFYHATFVRAYNEVSGFLAGWFDQGLIDGIVNGLGSLSRGASQALRLLQTGFVRSYALMFLFGVVVIITYLVVWQIR
ncbi:MAG TPA: NADH-quinone oxidoreductase subunit L [Anaerolineaceae bacterium]